MKKIIVLCTLVCLGILLGCPAAVPPPNHTVRIKSEYAQSVLNCAIGSVSYGTVAAGATTSYKSVADGAQTFSGQLVTGAPISKAFTLSGNGSHLWTVTISAGAVVSVAED